MTFAEKFQKIVPLLAEAKRHYGNDKGFKKLMKVAYENGGDEGLLGFLAGILGKSLPSI